MKVERAISLAPFTSFRVGGLADFFVRVHDEATLAAAILFAKEKNIPYFLLGGGTNILFADEGFRGLVIKNEISTIDVQGTHVRAGAGAGLGFLIAACATHGLSGLENMAGLPGTVGGAVAGNAGSYGTEIGARVVSARLLGDDGTRDVDADFFAFRYRWSRLKETSDILIFVDLELQKSTPEAVRALLLETAKKRVAKEPGGKNAGSFWKNPKDKKAWELIDSCGLRGARVGDAAISEKHANYLVNLGAATAADMLALAEKVEAAVQKQHGVTLQREVRVIPSGAFPSR